MARPLVVVTRPGERDDPLGAALRAGGADVVWLPTTSVLPPVDPVPLDDAVAGIADVDWLVFTSGHGVSALCSHRGWADAWRTAAPRRPRVAAVGVRTAERLAARGVPVDLVPAEARAAALVDALVAAEGGSLAGRLVLWPRSDIARRELPDGLARAGARVLEPIAYRTVAAAPSDLDAFQAALAAGRVHAVCFLSPSAADGLAAVAASGDLTALKSRCIVASLGPTTSGALSRLGAPPDVEAARHTAAGLAAALLDRLSLSQGASR